ncbi:MFS transporter [Saccharopolyspora sp. NPDC002686]|uniref:MFS transporter n=1 Tax=Saccharopolyspora sp. NPDC002686 TaxID=3154541 RepID=UPI00331704FD
MRHRSFRYLVAGRTIVYLGNAIAPVALAFAVLDGLGSVAEIGLIVACRSAANVLLLLFGGVLADRFPRQHVLTGASLLAAGSQGLVAVAVLQGFATVPLLALLSVVNGAAAAAALPASSALIPQTVPVDVLRPANALARMGTTGAMIAGTSAGGLLIAVTSPGWGLAVDAAAFAVAAACFAGIRVPAVAERGASVRAELREGWREFRSRRWVWAVVLQFLVVNAAVVGGINVLGPKIAEDTVGRGAWGLVLAVQMVGALCGGLIAARWSPERALLFGCAVVVLDAIPLVVLAVSPVLWLLLVAMFISGIAIEQFAVAWETALQQNIPEDRLARVYSYDALGSFLAMPIGAALIGPVATGLGDESALLITAASIVIATAAVLTVPEVRNLRSASE